MTNDQNAVRGKHLDSLAGSAKRYVLQEVLDVTNAVAAELADFTVADFTGAGLSSAGLSGLVPAPSAGDENKFLRGDGEWATIPSGDYTAGYGLSLADGEFSVTLQGGNGGLSAVAIENINDFFTPKDELKDRYAEAPFGTENIFGLDLSNLIDGENFELDTENLTDGAVTRIRSGTASYNVNNGISRGYVEVKTLCRCQVVVLYSISSQGNYDYGGCIVTEDAPNTEFTYANLKAANFFKNAGKSLNQTATYTLAANKTYYLNFGYAKNASTNTNDDRFYIHSIKIRPLDLEGSDAVKTFIGSNATLTGTNGLVPAPLVANRTQFLRGDCTWATPTNTTYPAASTSTNGLMSSTDKTKLNNLPATVAAGLGIAVSSGVISVALGTVSSNSEGAIWIEVEE